MNPKFEYRIFEVLEIDFIFLQNIFPKENFREALGKFFVRVTPDDYATIEFTALSAQLIVEKEESLDFVFN